MRANWRGLITIFWFMNTSCGDKVKTRWGFVILTYPSRRLPTTSFILLVNTLLLLLFPIVFRVLRQRWVIPLPPLQNPAFTNPDSFFSRIRTVFIRFSSLEFFGNCRLGNVVFLALSFSLNIQKCLSRARVTVNSMGETPVPPFFFYGALTPGEGPLFQNKHSFYTPSSLFVKGERGFRPPSFFYGAFSLNVFLFQLGGHCTSINLICDHH